MTDTALLAVSQPAERTTDPRERTATRRRLVMCRPTFFDVAYSINPWMDPAVPVDRDLALAQWQTLRSTYARYGHQVHVVTGEPQLPDMVFAANGGLAIGDRAMAARFTFPERQGETAAYRDWFTAHGFREVSTAADVNEGQGDFLLVGDLMLAATGFRTSLRSHHEVREYFDVPVVSLELVDPRFYHLDTALCVLDADNVAYYPPAFSRASNAVLRKLFPSAVIATDADAEVLGLNALSDGRNVFLTAAATDLHAALRTQGYHPVGVDLSELLKAGGGVKCCTLELHP